MAKKIEREVEELLQNLDKFVPENPAAAPPAAGKPPAPPAARVTRATSQLAHVSLRQVMLWSLATVVFTFFLREVPGMGWVMLAAILVFATSFALSIGAPPPPLPRDAEGQPIKRPAPAWVKGLKAFLHGSSRPKP